MKTTTRQEAIDALASTFRLPTLSEEADALEEVIDYLLADYSFLLSTLGYSPESIMDFIDEVVNEQAKRMNLG